MATGYRHQAPSATVVSTPSPTRASQGLIQRVQNGFGTVARDPNRPIRVRGVSGLNAVSLHPSRFKGTPVQAWFDETGQFIILESERQRAQVWDAATNLPVTPVFPSRHATNETGYLNIQFPDTQPSTLNSQRATAELLSGSRLDGTGGWKPLELGEIVERWNRLKVRNLDVANRENRRKSL